MATTFLDDVVVQLPQGSFYLLVLDSDFLLKAETLDGGVELSELEGRDECEGEFEGREAGLGGLKG